MIEHKVVYAMGRRVAEERFPTKTAIGISGRELPPDLNKGRNATELNVTVEVGILSCTPQCTMRNDIDRIVLIATENRDPPARWPSTTLWTPHRSKYLHSIYNIHDPTAHPQARSVITTV
jgi:hypothetical protein